MNQRTCNPAWLDGFLNSDLTESEEQGLTSHLDECSDCRDELENRAAEQSAWREAANLLGGGVLRSTAAIGDFRTGTIRSPQIELILRQLAPTDDPESLGRIGGYEVIGVVGVGGMGVVLKAHDRSLDRIVAIKVMSPHLASNGSARKRFAREAKAAAAVLHPNVIAIHSVASENASPYLVMPYVRGESLQKRIDSQGPLPLNDTLRIGAQVAAGLAAAHEQGLVHRDIKPANILLEEGVERVAITDFGLARAVDDASMTCSGVIAGTPQYMSPEQTRGEPIDARSDLFSLGSVMYAMCAGRSPFRAETTYGVLHRIANDRPTPVCEVNSDVPVWLGHIIQRLIAKRPDDRFESAAQVSELLEGCLAHVQQPAAMRLPEAVTALAPRKIRQPPIGKFIAAAVFALAIVFAGILIVLELDKGTLRIECEAEDVPIRIVQGDETVKQLTVSNLGASTRLRAGNYTIEVDGDHASYEILGNEVTLKRGQIAIATIGSGKKSSSLTIADAQDARNPAKLLTTWEEVEARVASMVKERQAIANADVVFRLDSSGMSNSKRRYHIWLNERNKRADCRGVSSGGTEEYSEIATPTFNWFEDHQDKSKSQFIRRDPKDADGWGWLGCIIDVRKIGLVNWYFETLGSIDFDGHLLPRSRTKTGVEIGNYEGKPITIVKFELGPTRDLEGWGEYWLSPYHGNYPIYMASGYTEPNSEEKHVMSQHTQWKLVDGIWFPTIVKHRNQCEHGNIDDTAIFELVSARLNAHPFPNVFDPLEDTIDLHEDHQDVLSAKEKMDHKSSTIKHMDPLEARTLDDVTSVYNELTRQLRLELFNPPIPDLTTDQMQAAMLDKAPMYRKLGKIEIASALETSAESGRLVDGLTFMGSMGTNYANFRQITPAFKCEVASIAPELCVLRKAELRYSLNGWSSTTWGDIHPPITGKWDLVSVEEFGEKLTQEVFNEWRQKHSSWTALSIDAKSLTMAGDNATKFDFSVDYGSGPLPYYMISQKSDTKFEGVLMGNGFVDDTTLVLAVDLKGSSKPKKFDTKDGKTTNLTYRRNGARP